MVECKLLNFYLHSGCQATAYEEMFYNKVLQWQDDNSSLHDRHF